MQSHLESDEFPLLCKLMLVFLAETTRHLANWSKAKKDHTSLIRLKFNICKMLKSREPFKTKVNYCKPVQVACGLKVGLAPQAS